jgi:hypothetical protein
LFSPKSKPSINSEQPTRPDALSSVDQGPEPVSPAALMMALGDELGQGLTELEDGLLELYSTGKTNGGKVKAMLRAAEHARRVAKVGQQIGRLLGGRLRQSHEKLSLKDIVDNALSERKEVFRRVGIEIQTSIKPVDVIVDPGLLMSVVEAALDWAAERGTSIFVSLGIKNWPQHAQLIIKSRDSVSVPSSYSWEPPPDSMTWFWLYETARTLGASLQRQQAADESTLTLEFPRTVREIEGMMAVEMESSFVGLSSGQASQPLAGYRVLVLSEDAALRNELRDATRHFGIMLDAAASVGQAVRYCEMELPHLIIFDERINDDLFEELRRDLLRQSGVFPFIEIATDANAFEVSGWSQDSHSRIGRDAIRTHLGQAMTMELAKIM